MHPQKHFKKKGTWKSVITNVSMCGCVQTSAANTPGRDGRGDLWCVGVAVSFIERGTRGSGVAHKVLLTFILRNKAEAAKQTQKPPAGKEGWWQRCRQRLIQEWSRVSITAKSRLCLLCASALFFWFGHLHSVISRWVPEPPEHPLDRAQAMSRRLWPCLSAASDDHLDDSLLFGPRDPLFHGRRFSLVTGGIYNINDGCVLFSWAGLRGGFDVAHGDARPSIPSGASLLPGVWDAVLFRPPHSCTSHRERLRGGASRLPDVAVDSLRLCLFFSFSLFVCYC